MGLQRVGHDWATELNWTELNQLTGHEFEQTLEDSGGQRSLACYSQWGVGVGWVVTESRDLATEQQQFLFPMPVYFTKI